MGVKQTGVFFGLLAGAFWGFSFLVPKIMSDVAPGQIVLGRFAWFGLLSLLTLVFRNGFRKNAPLFRYWKEGLVFSLSGYSVYYFLLVMAIQRIGIPLSSLIVGLIPVTVACLSRDPVRKPKLLYRGLGLIILGMGILNREAFRAESFWRAPSTPGMVLACVCLGLWTYFALANGKFLKSHSEINAEEWTSVLGVYTVLSSFFIYLVLPQEGLPSHVTSFGLKFFAFTAFLGLFSTYFATRLWNRASVVLPNGVVGQLIVSETIFALVYGYAYDHTVPRPLEWSAMVMVIGGVFLAIRAYPIFDGSSPVKIL